MSNIPILNYLKVVNALKRDGWAVLRQKGSHIRLRKIVKGKEINITVPAHKPIKKFVLMSILNQAQMTIGNLIELL